MAQTGQMQEIDTQNGLALRLQSREAIPKYSAFTTQPPPHNPLY